VGWRAVRITADTNVLVRAVMGDDPVQSPAAATMLRAATSIAVTLPALCEFVWVLSRAYQRSNADIAEAIARLLAVDNVVADRAAASAGLKFLAAGGDFADGVIAHQGRGLGGDVFVSFDRAALSIAKRLKWEARSP